MGAGHPTSPPSRSRPGGRARPGNRVPFSVNVVLIYQNLESIKVLLVHMLSKGGREEVFNVNGIDGLRVVAGGVVVVGIHGVAVVVVAS